MTSRSLRLCLAVSLSGVTALALVACEGAITSTPDDAARADGGRSDAASTEDTGPVPDGGAADAAIPPGDGAVTGDVPIFVAQGYVDRTTISCDDGRTWIANQATERDLDGDGTNDLFECFDGIDCDHDRGRAKGITYAHGWFVATWGWGAPGTVRRSRDGRAWADVLTGHTYGGIANGESAIVLGSGAPQRSIDDGATWTEQDSVDVGNVRRAGYAPGGGGRWILVGEDGGTVRVRVSRDGGESFVAATAVAATCGRSIQNDGGIGHVGDVIVMVGGDGAVCSSSDGGDTWIAGESLGAISSSEVVSTGTEVLAWGEGQLHRTSDGTVWTHTPLASSGVSIGAVARSSSGTFVAVNSGWDRWYDQQRFYRSADGVTWEALAAGAFAGSHPIHQITWGMAAASACP
jgi:hypothetical protein